VPLQAEQSIRYANNARGGEFRHFKLPNPVQGWYLFRKSWWVTKHLLLLTSFLTRQLKWYFETARKSTNHGKSTRVSRYRIPCSETFVTVLALPIISVCPVKRPKLDSAGKKYSFKQEKELMRDKIRTALRIAVYYRYHNLCIGSFGLGPGFRNPTEEVALMWRQAFLEDDEFKNHFEDVVFAFENPEGPGATVSSSSSKSSKSSSSKTSSSKSTAASDLEIFKHVFKPMNIHGAFKPKPHRG
jgi:hypothetical protein